MYSQYSYYQSNLTSHHVAPQQVASTSTSDLQWNGSQWVSASGPVASSTNSTYAQVAAIAPTTCTYAAVPASSPPLPYSSPSSSESDADLVKKYTEYYHYWSSVSREAQVRTITLAHGSNDRDESERREKWATYYSSNSAALAHYHLSISRGVPANYPPPPPPPPPPAGVTASTKVAAVVTAVSDKPQSVSAGKAKKSRWGDVSKSKAVDEGHGKFGVADGGSTVSLGTASTSESLYLNKFVQEKKPTVSVKEKEKNEDFLYFGRPGSINNVSKSQLKRKVSARDDESSVSVGSHFYSGGSLSKEEDFLSLPLASKPKTKLGKNKLKKKEQTFGTKNSDGFEQNETALAKRANRFKGQGGIDDVKSSKTTVDNIERYSGQAVIGGSMKQLDDKDFERMTVKGTCQVSEKHYLRLTAPPRPELVRPQPVLQRHLANLKKAWNNRDLVNNKHDYDWFCSQFKAIRQDLKVQRKFNAAAVDVYETHAKIALEEDDLNEFNQSQTQLKELYESIQGREHVTENRGALRNINEFIGYRIIYYVLLSGNKKYDGGSSDIFKIMLELTPLQRNDPFIRHALLVRAAVADYDYHAFFRLQDQAPNLSPLLMDKMVPSVRQWALQRICKAYRPSVSSEFVLTELGFDTQSEGDVALGKAWMASCGCRFSNDDSLFITKDTVLRESTTGAKNSLI